MAYLGSTQLSSVANPPILLWKAMGSGVDARITDGSTSLYVHNSAGLASTGTPTPGRGYGQALWLYHTTDTTTGPLATTGYFTDAADLGMIPGHIVMVVRKKSTVESSQYLMMGVVSDISKTGAASFSTGSMIVSSLTTAW